MDFVFGVDLDNVCGNHTAAFRRVVASERNISPRDLTLEVSWDYQEWDISTREEFRQLHRLAVTKHRIFRTMDPIAGAAEALWRLSDAGVWIRLITHRLYTNGDHGVAVTDTVEWLDEHNIPYRDLCFMGEKPQVGASVYVDDGPHNIEALRAAGAFTIVYEQPYNRTLEGPRARNWEDVERIVLEQYENAK